MNRIYLTAKYAKSLRKERKEFNLKEFILCDLCGYCRLDLQSLRPLRLDHQSLTINHLSLTINH